MTWIQGTSQHKKALMPFETESQLSIYLDDDELERGEEIGSGGFGTVYRGMYRGRKVAIKMLKEKDEVKLSIFTKEVEKSSQFRHPAIVGFVGFVKVSDNFSIVTDLCQYGSLSSAMKKYPEAFNEILKVKCLLDIAYAMIFLHQSGIIHRDLKSDNFLVVSLDPHSEVCAKLSDFGLTRDFNRFQSEMAKTVAGTYIFMAPEMFLNKSYDKSVDVYSFAMVMYFVLTGKLPFEDA